MKHKFIVFIDSLISYDYILFGSILALFFFFILLALLLRKKTLLSFLLVLFSFIFLFVAPFVGYTKMHNTIFKKELTLVEQKKLHFAKAVVVWGKLKNISKRDFKTCLITANVLKLSQNKYKNYIYTFKPIMKMSIIEENIIQDAQIDFKIIIEPYTYTKDYTIKLEADCR